MKNKFLLTIAAISLFVCPKVNFGQTVNLGTAARFVLFSSDGAVTANTSNFSQITGDIGTGNSATPGSGFGNINGTQHDGDSLGKACATDLLIAYGQLDKLASNFTISATMGNGATLIKGVYFIPNAATLDGTLLLDAKGDSGAVFVFQIDGSFAAHANSKVKLINGALACNVFWKVEGLIDMASGTTMRGTIVVNNAAITMAVGDTLEGRAFSTTGAITINKLFAYTPLGCGTAVLTGPKAPVLGAAECFALFSSNGAVTNSGTTKVLGDVGSNSMSPTGFVSTDVTGTIHAVPDVATANCKKDLALAYTYLSKLKVDIELKFPAQFGHDLVLTPHTYLLDAATVLTDTVYLNAQGNVNGVFVITMNGALSTTVHSRIKLINGAQAKNVYWKIEGAVGINDNSLFCGTLIVNNGALGALNNGVTLNGRALTTSGALTTDGISTTMTPVCLPTGISSVNNENSNDMATIYPNPFAGSVNVLMNDVSGINTSTLLIYNVLGEVLKTVNISDQLTTLDMNDFCSGVYFYKLFTKNTMFQSGKLVKQQ